MLPLRLLPLHPPALLRPCSPGDTAYAMVISVHASESEQQQLTYAQARMQIPRRRRVEGRGIHEQSDSTEFAHGQRHVLLARRRVLETVNSGLPPLRRQSC